MKVVCITDMGRSREANEDNYNHYKFENGWNLLIVADGMGGHNAGEVASSIAVKTITDFIKDNIEEGNDIQRISCLIKDSILYANKNIYNESLNYSNFSGMGTTVTIAMINNNIMLIGHVGDSRAYVFSNNKLYKITNDHSLVAELVKNGTITEYEAQHHPQKNIITRALGTENDIEIDIENVEIKLGDIIVLCTDGLTNMLCDEKISNILIENDDISNVAHNLVDLANEMGGYDNITVIVADIADPDGEVEQ